MWLPLSLLPFLLANAPRQIEALWPTICNHYRVKMTAFLIQTNCSIAHFIAVDAPTVPFSTIEFSVVYFNYAEAKQEKKKKKRKMPSARDNSVIWNVFHWKCTIPKLWLYFSSWNSAVKPLDSSIGCSVFFFLFLLQSSPFLLAPSLFLFLFNRIVFCLKTFVFGFCSHEQ